MQYYSTCVMCTVKYGIVRYITVYYNTSDPFPVCARPSPGQSLEDRCWWTARQSGISCISCGTLWQIVQAGRRLVAVDLALRRTYLSRSSNHDLVVHETPPPKCVTKHDRQMNCVLSGDRTLARRISQDERTGQGTAWQRER